MKLEDFQQGEKLSLDFTPMIDVVFLLVLFFAVGTSFISPETVDRLKAEVAGLTQDRRTLSDDLERQKADSERHKTELEQRKSELNAGNDRIVLLDERLIELQNTLQALATTKQQQRETITALYDANTRLEELAASQQTLMQRKDGLIDETGMQLRDLGEKHTTLTGRFEALESDHRRLRAGTAVLEQEKGALSEEVERMRAALAAARAGSEKYRAMDEQLSARQDLIDQTSRSLGTDLSSFLADRTLDIKKHQDRLTIHLSDTILFDSGSDRIKPGGLEVLARVGKVLKQRIDAIEIQIGGHTDNVPIRGKSGGLFDDNWGLSAARAVNVVRYLEEEVGIPADHMSAAGHSHYRPIADNATVQGRALNRRIEIVLLPR